MCQLFNLLGECFFQLAENINDVWVGFRDLVVFLFEVVGAPEHRSLVLAKIGAITDMMLLGIVLFFLA